MHIWGNLEKKISNYDIISFDVFDTLITRIVPDEKSIFDFTEQMFNQGSDTNISDFAIKRINAQTESQKHHTESTLDDIYSYLECYPQSIVSKLKSIELVIQRKVCFPNPEMKEVFEYCRKMNKHIIITSDMYLSSNEIESILTENGYQGFSEVFVSGDLRANKRSGEIFPLIIKRLNVQPKSILHIGDAKRGDFICPLLAGMHAYLYTPNSTIQSLQPWLNRYAYLTLPTNASQAYSFGFIYLGPLLYSFTNWLLENLRKDKTPNVFFLAREGLLLSKAYSILSKDSDAKSSYLYVSRHSTVLPSLTTMKEPDPDQLLGKVFFLLKFINYFDLLHEVGCDSKWIEVSLPKYGINPYDTVPAALPKEIKKIIRNQLSDYIPTQRELLKRYLLQSKFNDHATVVDIGWRGSMQRALNQIHVQSNFNETLKGYYLGLSKETLRQQDINAVGCVFSRNSNSQLEDMLTGFRGLMEGFFLASHGTTLRYTNYNGSIKPILEKAEYSRNDITNITKLQQGALDFITTIHADSTLSKLESNAETCFESLAHVVMQPNSRIFLLLRNMPIYDYGIIKPMVPKLTLDIRINPKKLYKEFIKSPWRIGFLKELLKVNINYEKLYMFLRRFQ